MTLLTDIEEYIDKNRSGDFIRPLYENLCFSNIPQALFYLFGLRSSTPLSNILNKTQIIPRRNQKIILLLLDSFGYHQWVRYQQEHTFLKQMTEKGIVSPITSVFPSTTAAAITTIHTGLTPQEHGLPEWFVYFEEVDQIIKTLPFAAIDEKGQNTLLKRSIDPHILFTGQTIYQQLAKENILSFVLARKSFAHSAYSSMAHEGSQTISFLSLSDLLVNLQKKMTEIPSPAYFHVYWEMIDSISHEYGPHSEQYLKESSLFFDAFYREFLQKMPRKIAEETIILITADHGHLSMNPQETIYLNRYSKVVNHLKIGPNGTKILPWGSPRDIFLAIKEEKLEEVFHFLDQTFKNRALVMKTDTALTQGIFGSGPPHPQFKSRIGNLLILPHEEITIWYKHAEDFDLRGIHGGLSAKEMLVPLAIAKGSDLIS